MGLTYKSKSCQEERKYSSDIDTRSDNANLFVDSHELVLSIMVKMFTDQQEHVGAVTSTGKLLQPVSRN